MTNDEKLKLARILTRITDRAAGGAILAKDAMQIVEEEFQAIAAESAPAAASVECQEFHELAMDYRAARFGAQTPYEALVTYVNTWGAQQREEGQQVVRILLDEEREKSAGAVARNVILRERAEKAESELAQHKAARIAYASEFALSADGEPDVGNIHANIRALKAQLAARPAVDLSKLQRYATITEMADHGKWLVANLHPHSDGAAVMLSDVQELLSQDKPAAPVGDGDERETLEAINKALAYLVKPSCVDAAISTLRSLRAALTQQKG